MSEQLNKNSEMPADTISYFVEMDEKDIHFLSSVIKGYDGVAHVRRDWIVRDERRLVKIMVPPGFEQEVERLFEHAKKYINMGVIEKNLDIST